MSVSSVLATPFVHGIGCCMLGFRALGVLQGARALSCSVPEFGV